MAIKIKGFSDGRTLEYDRGTFDNWCVYLRQADGSRRSPRDTDYFAELVELGRKYGNDKVYADYVYIYDITGKEIEAEVLKAISIKAEEYKETLDVDVMFTILYMAMIAEERKENTKLGKRIKRLGIHAILKENVGVHQAANFMRGMGWREIAVLCKDRGF